jgi:hypothetical protein
MKCLELARCDAPSCAAALPAVRARREPGWDGLAHLSTITVDNRMDMLPKKSKYSFVSMT